MKRWLLFFVITLVVALGAGSLAGQDSGYVLLSWHHYSLETSLWFFLLLLGVMLVAVYFLFRFSLVMLGSDWRFNEWRRSRRTARARKQTTRGLLSLALGQWPRAERLLTRSATDTDMPLINYLAAARAAYEQGKHDTTDELLSAASKSTRGADLAVGISHAQLLISRGHKEQALAVLVSLRDRYPRHSYLLKLLVRLYQDLEDWVALHELLPILGKAGKAGKIPESKLKELEEKVYLQLIDRTAKAQQSKDPVAALKKLYQSMPRHCRRQGDILLHYTDTLHELGEDEQAEVDLRNGLAYVWRDDLLLAYARLNGADARRRFLFAEKQLQERPNDPVLLLILARLALRLEQPERAREFLLMGLKLKNLPGLNAEMGKLLVQEQDHVGASRYFQQALAQQDCQSG
ncbi:heme biosynthesis HemY N-terminal domain-containing protein [Oceanobacter sp. 5_MG-2023]|uniref:heme biosynthesis HemY N-terminal domain-containing protein n=1 Tax=Oceanobacter sp. 5_MG-2023 TaxID=3062645 RepID=UPI0026E474EE|nr:heme biosynthesis HemY N-terminal domain-containing protein [Oceanobacter sp. 5_MG-2023]MDO6680816.1 heme biosynthesis HemY N-terminal domain-containing protein [Oceanobacter sp. 5_MG-2023]